MPERIKHRPQVRRTVVGLIENQIYDPTADRSGYVRGFTTVVGTIVKVEGEPRQRVVSGPVTSIVVGK